MCQCPWGLFQLQVMRGLDLASLLSTAAGESHQCLGEDVFPHLNLNPIRQRNIKYAKGMSAWLVVPCSLQHQAFLYPLTVFSDSIMLVGFERR